MTFWIFYHLCNRLQNIGNTLDSRFHGNDGLIIIELRKSNATLSILLHPPHPPLSPDYGGEDKGEGV